MNVKAILATVLGTVAFLSAAPGHAREGIEFFTGTWQEALARARAEKKPIFVDVYTSWCGPCKQMAQDIFPLAEVGAKFNASFINYKVDAEKGEGVRIAREFGVNAYPTYLFVSGDGVLCYRTAGSMPAENFIAEADKALTEFKDPRPLPVWEAEYPARKQDKAFLLQYLQKRKNLELDSGEVLDQYASLASREELLSKEVLPALLKHERARVDGPFYAFLTANKAEVVASSGMPAGRVDAMLGLYAGSDLERAIRKGDAQLMEKIVTATLDLPARGQESAGWRADQIRMRFYSGTRNEPELIQVLQRYGREVAGYDREKVEAEDAAGVKEFDAMAKTAPKDTPAEQLESARRFYGKRGSMDHGFRLRDIADSALKAVNDRKVLEEALQWTTLAGTYSDNFTILETRAGLLHKLGRTAEAIQEQRESIAAFDSMKIPADDIRSRLTEGLEKMKAGKPTWIVVETGASVPLPAGGK